MAGEETQENVLGLNLVKLLPYLIVSGKTSFPFDILEKSAMLGATLAL